MEKHGEGAFRQQVTKELRNAGLFVSTVEGGGMGGTPGIPDVYYSGVASVRPPIDFSGPPQPDLRIYVEGWIELKVIRGDDVAAKARESAIPLVTGITHYTQQQRVWHTRHSRGGGKVHVFVKLVWEQPWFHMFEGGWAAEHLGRDLLLRDFSTWNLADYRHNPCKFPTHEHLVRMLMRNAPQVTPIA